MPNEPENNMDKLLKAYAQKRREEAAGPFEMHGATRQLLQSEVARSVPQRAARPQGWRKLFSGFWSGLAWGGSMVAVLALASLVWLEKGPLSTRELARNTEGNVLSITSQESPLDKAATGEAAPKSSVDLSALRPESQSEQKADAYNFQSPMERSLALPPTSDPMPSAAPAAPLEINRRGGYGRGGRGGAAARPDQTPRSAGGEALVDQGVIGEARLGLAGASSQPKSESSPSKPESPMLRAEGVSQRLGEMPVNEALAKAKSAVPTLAPESSDKKALSETVDHLALKDDTQVMKREKELVTASAAADTKQESLSRFGLSLAPTSNSEPANVLPSTLPEQKVLLQTPATPAPTVPGPNLGVRGITVTDNRDALAAAKGAVSVPGGAGVKDDFSRNPTLGIETKNQPLPNLAQALPQDSPALPEQSTQVWAFYKTQTVSAPEGDSNAVRLYFSQGNSRARFRQNFNSPPYPNILTAFQVQRNGNNLSIVDADGSVYEGQMEASNTEALDRSADRIEKQVALQTSRRAVAQKPAQVLSVLTNNPRGAEPNQSPTFRATGTNRSLNQKVVFTGNFLPGSNTLNVAAQAEGANYSFGATAGSNATRTDQTAPIGPALGGGVPAPNSNSPSQQFRLSEPQIMQWGRIEGKASVGGKSEYRIEAIRVGP